MALPDVAVLAVRPMPVFLFEIPVFLFVVTGRLEPFVRFGMAIRLLLGVLRLLDGVTRDEVAPVFGRV